MNNNQILIFPISTPLGKDFMRNCLQNGESAVGASCDEADPTYGRIPWHKLPHIHSKEFLGDFKKIINLHQITRVFAAAHMIHEGLQELLKSNPDLNVTIINKSPLELYFSYWDEIFLRAKSWKKTICQLDSNGHSIDEHYLAGVIHHAFNIFGESYDEKLAALLACLISAPEGDIVEIGTLFGRSLCVLISGRSLGEKQRNVFVFDPWSSDIGLQKDLPAKFQEYTKKSGIEKVPAIFESIFSVYAPPGSLSAYRCASEKGFQIYAQAKGHDPSRIINCYRPTTPQGKIALLHIDGNHDLEYVSTDVNLWSELVISNGWVVIDDYEWRYGSGPKVAGDKLLDRWNDQISRTFIIGGCLFIQKK